MSKAIFVYSCAPTRPAGPDDGGFSVNLFEENMLVYTRYAVDGSVIKEWQFAVPPRVIMEYMATVNHARGWVRGMFPCLRVGEHAPRYISRIGIDGFPIFLMEDIQALMNCPFRSARGHYARMMYNLLEALRVSLILLTPFIPESCGKAFDQIGADGSARTWDAACEYGVLPADVAVRKGETLFPRIDAAKMLSELEEAEKAAKGPQVKVEPVLPDVDIEDFAKCDMRVCKVLQCEAVKKSKKLLRFELDDGSGVKRQILSGIREFYEPEQLIGKTVVAILNLPPRKMMGLESCGMLLSAVREADGKEELHLLMLDDSVPAGSRLC